MEQTTAVEKKKSGTLTSYTELRRKVEQAFASGLERAKYAVEQEKIRTTWEVGRLMDEHILHHKERAGYREKVIVRLARDVNQSRTYLYYALELARTYHIVPHAGQLVLSDFQDLLSINDKTKRDALAREAAQSNWSRAQLREKIKKAKSEKNLPEDKRPAKKSVRNRIIPKRGKLNTYRIVRSETVHRTEEFLIDLGFSSFIEVGRVTTRKFQDGDIIQIPASEKPHSRLRITKLPGATRRNLFTYRAFVERVVDADTLWVRIDLGFGVRTRQKLRLRGIEAPEQEIYLNQLLVDKGLAKAKS